MVLSGPKRHMNRSRLSRTRDTGNRADEGLSGPGSRRRGSETEEPVDGNAEARQVGLGGELLGAAEHRRAAPGR